MFRAVFLSLSIASWEEKASAISHSTARNRDELILFRKQEVLPSKYFLV